MSYGENEIIKQQEQSTVNPQKHNIVTCQKSPSEINKHVSNDGNFAVDIAPDVLNLTEQNEFKIITCELLLQ
ncbi:hypothetical protein HW555_009996 [Spodoptera exigua]|uniref:Uncharacterized protein n=1 Tax=Spodoptera exigua TaxID=7107 RepID=A0A835GBY4_SPOEX|nr:hypothetical protein HW555_009996 [Spodoptera exigua]